MSKILDSGIRLNDEIGLEFGASLNILTVRDSKAGIISATIGKNLPSLRQQGQIFADITAFAGHAREIA